jgi:polyferredoxin
MKKLRILYQLFFFSLFCFLFLATTESWIKGYPVRFFLDIDPLIALSTLLSTHKLTGSLLLALLIALPTFFLGRFFCSWVCPFGAIHNFCSEVLARLWQRRRLLTDYTFRPLFRLKYYLLIVFLLLSLAGVLQVGLLDPIAFLTRSATIAIYPMFRDILGWVALKTGHFQGSLLLGTLFFGVIFLNLVIPRFWCRTLCPLGALLGLMSKWAPFRIVRHESRCTGCNRCARVCQGAANPHKDPLVTECLLCLNCESICPERAVAYQLSPGREPAKTEVSWSRRRLLESFATAPLLFLLSGPANAKRLGSQVLRPPGALPENAFLARCVKCGQCMKICPTNALQPALLETGLEGMFTPLVVPKIGYCEYNCTRCGEVCPTGAIRRLTSAQKTGNNGQDQPIRIGTAYFDPALCIPHRGAGSCIVCEEMCPVSPKAIWWEKVSHPDRQGNIREFKVPHVDEVRCVGCGICEYVCPLSGNPAIKVFRLGESRARVQSSIEN